MKAIILAAGYATRLYPLTQHFPKPLIEINHRPIIDYIIDKIYEIGIKDVYVVTNNKFYKMFTSWAAKRPYEHITIVNDNTMSNQDRLGAIGDIQYVVNAAKLDDDLLIVGGDNLFEFSLKKAKNLFRTKRKSTIIGRDAGTVELAKKYGVIELDTTGKVLSFQEKPAQPRSTFCAICVYFYPRDVIKKIATYLTEGNNPDAPGNYVAWLVKNETVYAQTHKGAWWDIGGFDSLKQAKEDFGEKHVNMEELKKGRMY